MGLFYRGLIMAGHEIGQGWIGVGCVWVCMMWLGTLASLCLSWHSNKGTFCELGMAGIKPMQSKSEWLEPAFALASYVKGAVYDLITYKLVQYNYRCLVACLWCMKPAFVDGSTTCVCSKHSFRKESTNEIWSRTLKQNKPEITKFSGIRKWRIGYKT